MARLHQLAIRLSRDEQRTIARHARAAKLAPSVWARARLLEVVSRANGALADAALGMSPAVTGDQEREGGVVAGASS